MACHLKNRRTYYNKDTMSLLCSALNFRMNRLDSVPHNPDFTDPENGFRKNIVGKKVIWWSPDTITQTV